METIHYGPTFEVYRQDSGKLKLVLRGKRALPGRPTVIVDVTPEVVDEIIEVARLLDGGLYAMKENR